MRKLLLIIMLLKTATATAGLCPEKSFIENQLLSVFKRPVEVKAIYPIGIDGFCRVITSDESFFIDTEGRYLVKGLIFKLPDRQVDKKFLSFLEKSVNFEAGNGEKSIYVIVDPDCEACRKSSEKMKLFFEKGIKLKFILAPFSSKEAEEKTFKFICSNGNLEKFISGDYSGKICTEGKLKVWSVMNKLKAKGLVSTPTFITEKGKVFSGENSIEDSIAESLRENMEKKENGAKPQN